MNYYNPYFYTIPTQVASAPKAGLISRLLGGGGRSFSFGSLLSGTQKVLGVANQAIPLVKQVQPMVRNAKTMFRVMNEFKRTDKSNNIVNTNTTSENQVQQTNNTKETNTKEIEQSYNYNDQGPTFFI